MSVNELKEVRSPKSASWQSLPLSKVCEKVSKVKRKTMPSDDKLLYLDIGGIDNNVNKVKSHKTYTWGEAPSRAQQIVQVGDTLFSTVRTYLKNIAKIENKLYNGQIASSGFTVLRPKADMLDENYLFYYTLSTSFLNSLSKLQIGSSYPAVRDKDVFAQKIPLPPLPEQRAIVAKLERLFTELDRSVAELEAARAKVGVYRQSVLREAFAGRLTGAEGKFEILPLSRIALEIRNGISAKPTGSEKDAKILRISSVRPFLVNTEDHRYLVEGENDYSRFLLRDGDLLFTRYNGSRHYVGVAGVFKGKEHFYYPDKLIRVRINQSRILPVFLMYAVNSGDSRLFVEERIRTTAGQSGISGRDVKQIPVPVPSMSDQHQIVQEIESRFSVADHLERTIEESLVRARGLRQGVLGRAFAGELTITYK